MSRVAHIIAKEVSWFSSKLMQSSLRSVLKAVNKVVLVDNGCSEVCRQMYQEVVVEAGLMSVEFIVLFSDENSFSALRNKCIEHSSSGDLIIKLDADDVHYAAGVAAVFDEMAADQDIHRVHGHFVHHRRDPWLQDKTGKHKKDIFFRQIDGMMWKNGVHEGVVGLTGKSLLSQYVYHHYGYTKSREELLEHWINYDILEFGEVKRYNLNSMKELDPNEDLHGQFKLDENTGYFEDHPPEVAWMFDGTMQKQGLRWTDTGLVGSDFNPLTPHLKD